MFQVSARILVIVLYLVRCLCTTHSKLFEWAHHTVLDGENNFHLKWKPGEKDITFQVEVATHGYFGFGLSPNGGMKGSDMVIGWMKDGRHFFHDCYATGETRPSVDEHQDWKFLEGFENDTHTIFRFRRSYYTCDEHDFPITNNTMRVIYAFHEKDPDKLNTLSYHGNEHRGSRSIILVQPNVKRDLPTEGVLYWDALSPNVTIPHQQDTTYWCKIIKAPELSSMHHVIKIVPVVQSGNEGYVHHVVLYQCVGEAPEKLETYLDHQGHECYHPNMPPVFRKCKGVMAAWGIGGETMVLPDHAGIPFGGMENKYFMIEVHYDNPALHRDVVDSSGLRLFYTKKLRKNDAVTLMAGANVGKTVIIPPGQQKYVVAGHCGHRCLEKVVPEDGLKIFAVFPHSHLIGKEILVRHFRNGSELAPIVVDRNYDFNYQEYRYLPEEVTILPEDHLTVECVYDSTSRQTTTFGGFSTKDEMCLAFFFYYPKTNMSFCLSSPMSNLIAGLAGYSGVFESPPSAQNEGFHKYIRDYKWPKSFMPVIQGALRYGPHEQMCENEGTYNEYKTESTTYPEAKPYKTISPCRSPDMKAHAISHQNLDPSAPKKSTNSNGVKRLKESHVYIFTTSVISVFIVQKLVF